MRAQLARYRDRLAISLTLEWFRILPAVGTCFLAADLVASSVGTNDIDFALRAVKECGIATIPFSAFYAAPPQTSPVRLCFAKSEATPDAGAERLTKSRRLFGRWKSPKRKPGNPLLSRRR